MIPNLSIVELPVHTPLTDWISSLPHPIGTLVLVAGGALIGGGQLAKRRQLARLSSLDRTTATLVSVEEETSHDSEGPS